MKQHIEKLKNKLPKKLQGFAMLYTVLIISLILTISLGISTVTFKQMILSRLSRDSQSSFYQADKGLECALYYDSVNAFPANQNQSNVIGSLTCGSSTLYAVSGPLVNGKFTYKEQTTSTSPCVQVVIDKTVFPNVKITASGYNICGNNPRKVERVLEVKY
jgi:Tfp pilus assembly protein PilX